MKNNNNGQIEINIMAMFLAHGLTLVMPDVAALI